MSKRRNPQRARRDGARWIPAILAALLGLPATAAQFSVGGTDLSLDSTLSYGAQWRTQDPSGRNIGIVNGGSARSANGDNGNLNYDSGDAVSSLFKATEELEVRRGNYGLFVRGLGFYDTQVHDDREHFGKRGYERLKSDLKILDAFVSARFSLFGQNSAVRAGWQVVNWGESSFIPNGLNVSNPVDVTKLRSPGAELREALLPSPMLWVSQGLTSSLSFEGYTIFDYDKTKIDPFGAYFSTTDALSDDGEQVFLTFGRRKDDHFAPTNPSPAAPLAAFGLFDPAASLWVLRGEDRRPNDTGQFGLSLRYLAPASWNNAEIGLYYQRYDSRVPLASLTKSTVPEAVPGATGLCSIYSGTPAAALTGHNCSIRYFAEFPEDIDVLGLSFNTAAPWGIALQGEYSFRPDLPLQLPVVEGVLASLNLPSQFSADPTTIPAGAYIKGFKRLDAHQLQFTGTKTFAQALGAEQVVLVAELGFAYLDLPAGIRFDGPGVALPRLEVYRTRTESGGAIQTRGYATKFSDGYRLVARAEYNNLLGTPVSMTPRLSFSHDVKGASPTFNQGAMAAGVGVNFTYRQNMQFDLGYTSFFGGRNYCGTDDPALSTVPTLAAGQSLHYCTSANPLRDRDFLSASISYAF